MAEPLSTPTGRATEGRLRPGSAAAYALVGAGGAVGSGLRHLLVLATGEQTGGFPTATLVVNVVGSFLLGVLVVGVTGPRRLGPWAGPALGTGVLGGFTTFSALANGVDRLAAGGGLAAAGGVLVLLLTTGLLAGAAGVALGLRLAPPPGGERR